MKKSFFALSGPLMLAVLFSLLAQTSHAQIVNEQTRKKFSIGVGMFTDIWNNPFYKLSSWSLRTSADVLHDFCLIEKDGRTATITSGNQGLKNGKI